MESNFIWLTKFEKSDFLVSKTLELSKTSNYYSRPHNQNKKYFKSLPRVPDRLNWQKKTELASLFGTVPLKKNNYFLLTRDKAKGQAGQGKQQNTLHACNK